MVPNDILNFKWQPSFLSLYASSFCFCHFFATRCRETVLQKFRTLFSHRFSLSLFSFHVHPSLSIRKFQTHLERQIYLNSIILNTQYYNQKMCCGKSYWARCCAVYSCLGAVFTVSNQEVILFGPLSRKSNLYSCLRQ